MKYNTWNVQEHILVKAIRYFVVVNGDSKRENVYLAVKEKRKWNLYLFVGQPQIIIFEGKFDTRAGIRKYILEQLNGGVTVSS